jgi:hypothetical protein
MRAGVYLWVHLAALPVGAAVLPLSDSTTEVPVAPIAVLTGRPAEEVERQPRVRVAVIRRAKTGHSSAPKTGHHVGGTGWKNRLIRFRWQGA